MNHWHAYQPNGTAVRPNATPAWGEGPPDPDDDGVPTPTCIGCNTFTHIRRELHPEWCTAPMTEETYRESGWLRWLRWMLEESTQARVHRWLFGGNSR